MNTDPHESPELLADRAVASLRWLVIALVLIAHLITPAPPDNQVGILLFGGVVILYSTILSVLLVIRRFPAPWSAVSPFLDGFWVAGLIILTGGLDSPYLLFFFLPLLLVALRMSIGQSVLAVSLASLTYLILALAASPTLDLDTLGTALERTGPYSTTCFLIVFFAGALAWGERRRLSLEQDRTAEVQRRLQEAYESIRAANDVATTLRSTMNYERVLDTILTEIARFVDYSVGFVLLFGGQGSALRLVAARGLLPRDRDRTVRANIGGAIGRVMEGAEILTVQDPARDPGLGQFATLEKVGTALCLPLRAGFELYGIVILASEERKTYSPEQLNLLAGLSNQAVIALQNSMLYQSLREERDRIIDSEEEARHQLARDLHDGPAQGLAAIVMKADFIRRLLARDPGRVEDELRGLEDIARQTTKEVRTLLFQLRPISLETQGLVPTLSQYAEKVHETDGLNLIVEAEELPELDPNVAATMFTIIQEAVNNAKKHAGTPDIWIRLGVRDENLVVEIQDHGKGFDLAAVQASYDSRGSLGLLNMEERAERVGGICSIQSAPNQGTLITIAVPLVH